MSVKISCSKTDEINSLTLVDVHPLTTLRTKTDDDTAYLTIPNEMLEGVIKIIKRNIDAKRDLHCLFSGDIKLRHDFDLSSIT